MESNRRTLLYFFLFILVYIGLNFTTSMHLMGYEDFWDDSKGEMWSLSTMETSEKIAYLVWFIPNFPFGILFGKGLIGLLLTCFVNPILVGYTFLRLSKKRRTKILKYGIVINASLTIAIVIIWTVILTQ